MEQRFVFSSSFELLVAESESNMSETQRVLATGDKRSSACEGSMVQLVPCLSRGNASPSLRVGFGDLDNGRVECSIDPSRPDDAIAFSSREAIESSGKIVGGLNASPCVIARRGAKAPTLRVTNAMAWDLKPLFALRALRVVLASLFVRVMRFGVAVGTQQHETFRVGLDFVQGRLSLAPLRLLGRVDVVKVQCADRSPVSTVRALAAELRDELRSASSHVINLLNQHSLNHIEVMYG
jgi:hypothetical protein